MDSKRKKAKKSVGVLRKGRNKMGGGSCSVVEDDMERELDNCFISPPENNDIYNCATEDEIKAYTLPADIVSWEDLMNAGEQNTNIEKGKPYELISLLSEKNSNFLISNDGTKFDVKTLEGKYVVVCCVFLPIDGYQDMILQAIKEAASEPDCSFQLVITANLRPDINSQLVFDHFFNTFPPTSLAIPYEESLSRDYVCSSLGLTEDCVLAALIVDPNGMVLQTHCNFFLRFGIKAFPFTDQHLHSLSDDAEILKCRVDDLYYECKAAFVAENELPTPRRVTLDQLLLLDHSQLISSATEADVSVSVETLKSRYVGLYICYNGKLMTRLCELHQQCKDRKLQFDILVVPIAFLTPRSSFLEIIRLRLSKYKISSSWWLFPDNDMACRRLWGALTISPQLDSLIILPPADSGLSGELQGHAVIRHYGVDAYPFIRASILDNKLQRLSKLTLESLFPGIKSFPHSLDYFAVELYVLQGKNVLIYIDTGHHPPDVYSLLIFSYDKIQRAHPGIVMVYVPPTSYKNVDGGLVHSLMNCLYSRLPSTVVASILFDKTDIFSSGSTIVAVGSNGSILSRRAQCYLDKMDGSLFADNLRSEIISDLANLNNL